MTQVVIHQPDFAPWLGFFDRLLDADIFIVLDDAQFLRRGWHHRDKIKTSRGPEWLTLSVEKSERDTPINRIRLSPGKETWGAANLNLIAENYRAAPHFAEIFLELGAIWGRPFERLMDFNLAILDFAYSMLGLRPNIRLSSEFGVTSTKTRRLVDLIRAVGGTRYLTGTGAGDYLENEMFADAGIAVEIRKFDHPIYPQLHGEFVPGLSCLDLFLNSGPDSAGVLRQCRVPT